MYGQHEIIRAQNLTDLVVHDRVDKYCHRVLGQNLLGWDLVSVGSEVNLLIEVNTGNDEEYPRAPGSSCQQPAEPEDDCPLVFLHS